MSEETFYVLRGPDTPLERWTLRKQEVELMPGFTEALAADISRTTHRVGRCSVADYGPYCVTVTRQWAMYSVSVLKLHLHSRFTLDTTGTAPVLRLTPAQYSAPLTTVTWEPPAGVRLLLGVLTESSVDLIIPTTLYLVAMHNNRRYKLPLPNLYPDGKMCHGQVLPRSDNADILIEQVATEFQSSVWNRDLHSDAQQAHTNALFRWSPNADGTFTQLPVDGDWITHCVKVANEVVDTIHYPGV